MDFGLLMVGQFLAHVVGKFRLYTFSIMVLGDFLGVDCIDTSAAKTLGLPCGIMSFSIRGWVGEDSYGDQLSNPVIGLDDDRSVNLSVHKDSDDLSFITRVDDSTFHGYSSNS